MSIKSSNINIPLIFFAVGTSTALALPYEETNLPQKIANYKEVSGLLAPDQNKSNELVDQQIIEDFAKKVILNSKNLDEEFQVAINKKFWDLL